MADYKINISGFLNTSRNHPVMDVRSPAEYSHGHIPGAVNMPLSAMRKDPWWEHYISKKDRMKL